MLFPATVDEWHQQLAGWEPLRLTRPQAHREQVLAVELGDRALYALRGCPAWCTDHYTVNEHCYYHASRSLMPSFGSPRVIIEQQWNSWDGGDKDPRILLSNYRIGTTSLGLTPLQARALADLFQGGGDFHDGIAAGLTEAA